MNKICVPTLGMVGFVGCLFLQAAPKKEVSAPLKPVRPVNFCMVPGYPVGGMARPTSARQIKYLQDRDVTLVVSLTPEPLSDKLFKDSSVRRLHVPIVDNCPPTDDDAATFLREIDAEVAQGHKVVVHCKHGVGRTGTVLATWLSHHEQMDPRAAIELTGRRLHDEQAQFVCDFYEKELSKERESSSARIKRSHDATGNPEPKRNRKK